MKIGLASSDWAIHAPDRHGRPTWGGAGWYRLGLPGKYLAGIGFDVVSGTLVWSESVGAFGVRVWPEHGQDPEEVEHHFDLDVIVLQRWMFASVAVETARAKASGQIVVQDVDDHFWALDPRNRAYEATDPQRNPIENREHYLAALKAASAVTVSTPALRAALGNLGVRAPIHVLPNQVEVSAFAAVREERRKRPSPVIGWVGSTSHRSGDLETLRGVLGPFLDRHHLHAYHGGHVEGGATMAAAVGIDRTRTAPMAPIDRYPELFLGLDIGLVPLRDVIFNRSKSWVKGLEYAAAGVPFVASALPEYVTLTGKGIGRLAHRPRDWHRHLAALLDDDVRAAEAEANLAAVGALDIRKGVALWRDLYLDLMVR